MNLADLREGYVERMKIRAVLGIIVIFIASMIMSCQELRYMISSKTVDARLEQSQVEKTGRYGRGRKRVLTYSFQDGSLFRREYGDVPLDWDAGNSQFVKVQYLPGKEKSSRVYGQRNLIWVTIFGLSMALAVAGVIVIARQK